MKFSFTYSEICDIAQLLELDEQILLNCLTKSGSSWLQIENGSELDAINANLINKALCRTLYGRLFTFVVNRINESLKVSDGKTFLKVLLKALTELLSAFISLNFKLKSLRIKALIKFLRAFTYVLREFIEPVVTKL